MISFAQNRQMMTAISCMANSTQVCTANRNDVQQTINIGMGLDGQLCPMNIEIDEGGSVDMQQTIFSDVQASASTTISQTLSQTLVNTMKARAAATAKNDLEKEFPTDPLDTTTPFLKSDAEKLDTDKSSLQVSNASNVFCSLNQLTTSNDIALNNNMYNSINQSIKMCFGTIKVGKNASFTSKATLISRTNVAVANGITTHMTSLDKNDVTSLLAALASNVNKTTAASLDWKVVLVVIIVLVAIAGIIYLVMKSMPNHTPEHGMDFPKHGMDLPEAIEVGTNDAGAAASLNSLASDTTSSAAASASSADSLISAASAARV